LHRSAWLLIRLAFRLSRGQFLGEEEADVLLLLLLLLRREQNVSTKPALAEQRCQAQLGPELRQFRAKALVSAYVDEKKQSGVAMIGRLISIRYIKVTHEVNYSSPAYLLLSTYNMMKYI
jgi:hypothetical protein